MYDISSLISNSNIHKKIKNIYNTLFVVNHILPKNSSLLASLLDSLIVLQRFASSLIPLHILVAPRKYDLWLVVVREKEGIWTY